MDALTLANPQIARRVLLDVYKKMSPAEFEAEYARVLSSAEEFMSKDDTAFTATLDEFHATSYANFCRTFVEAVRRLKKNSSEHTVAMEYLSHVVAWWRVVTMFRELHEVVPMKECDEGKDDLPKMIA